MRRYRFQIVRDRLACFLVAAGLFFGGCVGVQAQSGTPKPHAVALDSVYDFGAVSQGTKVRHEFKIKNEGTAPFNIQRVVPSCGCTASAADISTVPPGGEAKIKVEFDTSGFSGRKSKTVRVLTSDSERSAIDLMVKGEILPDVVADPAYISFGEVFVGPGGAEPKKVTVTVREGAGVTIGEVKAWSKAIAVSEVERSPSKRVLSVKLLEGVPPGELRDRVVVSLVKAGGDSALNIPVVASVKSEVVLRPATVSFGVIEGKERMVRKVTVSNLGKRPVKIKEITSTNPALSATFSAVDATGNFLVEVALDPTAIKNDFKEQLRIITDRQDVPPMALNVYGIVPPKL
ncbi:MAG: hypothetical protein RL417_1355 [Pseudomonadota bacterium]|jgi:hypothetical protein